MPYLCDTCLYGPPSSGAGKPCSFCDFDADNPVFNFYTRKEEPVMTNYERIKTMSVEEIEELLTSVYYSGWADGRQDKSPCSEWGPEWLKED